MADISHATDENKQLSKDAAAELISALRSSPGRLETLLWRYRNAGFTDREPVAAMAASPRLVDRIATMTARTITFPSTANAREWWALEARRCRSDWISLLDAAQAVVSGLRILHTAAVSSS